MQGSAIKPAVPLEIHAVDGRRFPIYALPDSGADASCFPESWAPVLGVVLEDCKEKPVNTGAGKTCHYVWEAGLTATILDRDITLDMAFGPIRVPVIGRTDFFAAFHVEFDERRHVTRIWPYVS